MDRATGVRYQMKLGITARLDMVRMAPAVVKSGRQFILLLYGQAMKSCVKASRRTIQTLRVCPLLGIPSVIQTYGKPDSKSKEN